MIVAKEDWIVTKEDWQDINNLLSQLSDKAKPVNWNDFSQILKQESFELGVIRDYLQNGKIIGMGSIILVQALTGLKALIEDVVVDESHRGKKLGEKIVRGLIEKARERNAKYMDLTSNPQRKAANKLYKKLGFKKRETNVYRLELNKTPQ